ncbi:Bacitracin export ATP-binding protein BceA [Collinsella aerofaciens]|uniref:Bacitracin export ATP-binding protein BceA n=2 Tax=Collinsella aerofaciens TaxID=74426 RepID=A0A5K1IXL8_9ACTN|nr:ATP-binding cassette domain-containing protein [Collinsella aerofaciens]VWL93810.1 Bacitracin export ATP-binding protein BceA [Collinsella aerofaciens]
MAAAEVRAEGVKRWADTGEERVPVLRGCSLAAAGGLTAIVGPSGAGKTSLLYCMSGLDAPDEGRVLVAGRDLYAMGEGARTRFLRQAAAFVFQSYNLVPYLTVEENATLYSVTSKSTKTAA